MHDMSTVPVSSPPVAPERRRGPVAQAITDHPALAFCVLAIVPTWLVQISAILLFGRITVGLLAEFVVLIGAALIVTGVAEGRPGLRRLWAGVIRWRVGVGWYLVALLGLAALTILIAIVTGTLGRPVGGWAPVIGLFFLQVVVLGALLGNVWEEMGWTGVVQRRWMDRYGFWGGAALTAIPFALIHLPMAFGSGFGVTWQNVLIIWGVLIFTAPILRWLAGVTYLGTGGSILIVGLLHASFNASGQLPVVAFGGATFLSIGAAVILLLILVAYRAVRLRSGSEAERDRLHGHLASDTVR
jgi:uncharacterized protein